MTEHPPRHRRLVLVTLLATSLLIPATTQATVEKRQVVIEIGPDRVVERQTLKVRLDDTDDIERWSLYAVALDEHRELRDFEATVVSAEGRRRKVRKRDRDRMQASDEMILHSSQSFEVIEPEGLTVGARLEIAHTVVTRPWFTAGQVGLGMGDEVESFTIEVRAEATVPGFRHQLSLPPGATAEVVDTPSGVRITGTFEPPTDISRLAVSESDDAVLRYAWSDDASWNALGQWYAGLLRTVPREPMTQLVRSLGADQGSPLDRLDRLVAFMRRKVRYVAVEVGIGGYAPSPPAEVADRMWGDCKDKGYLLIEMLQAAGIRAHPALIRLDDAGGIDPEFPTPLAFNHFIVAIDASTLGDLSDDTSSLPIAEGFVFIDATQTLGDVDYLHEGVQGQYALVVTTKEAGAAADGGQLVRTPWRPETDTIHLDVTLLVDAAGEAGGKAQLTLDGDAAAGLVNTAATTGPAAMESIVRRVLARQLPGATIDTPTWSADDGALPHFEASAPISMTLGDRPRLDGPALMPASREVDELAEAEPSLPAAVDAGAWATRYRLRLPADAGVACPPKPRDDLAENSIGRVHHTVELDDTGHLVIERRSALHRGRIEAEELTALRELAVAEHRARRRSIRWKCR